MRGECFREGGGIVQRLIFALCLPPTDSPLHLLRRLWKDVVRAQPGEQGVYNFRSRGRVYGKLRLLHSVAPSLRSRVRVPARGAPLSVNSRPPRPPARGGPTIYDRSTSRTNASSLVGPPLAGGLRRARTGFS